MYYNITMLVCQYATNITMSVYVLGKGFILTRQNWHLDMLVHVEISIVHAFFMPMWHFEFNLQTLKCPNPLDFKGKVI